jgi:hypothetical protein
MSTTADDIEKALSRVPAGSTMRTAHASAGAPIRLTRWDGVVPPPLDLPCAAGCGARVEHPGICDRCGAAREDADGRAEFSAALDSIPPFFRWASPGDPDLDKRVTQAEAISVSACMLADRLAIDLLGGTTKVVLVQGPRDAGKTSLACAVASTVVSAAIAAWIRYQRHRPSGRQAYAEPKVCGVGRGLFFVAARDIVPPKDRDPEAPAPKYARAMRSRFVVLDELGQEIEAREDTAATSARVKATGDLIAHWWDNNVPLLATTPMTEEQILRFFGGGVQKRLCKAEHVRVIRLKGKGT